MKIMYEVIISKLYSTYITPNRKRRHGINVKIETISANLIPPNNLRSVIVPTTIDAITFEIKIAVIMNSWNTGTSSSVIMLNGIGNWYPASSYFEIIVPCSAINGIVTANKNIVTATVIIHDTNNNILVIDNLDFTARTKSRYSLSAEAIVKAPFTFPALAEVKVRYNDV